tara:strand:+ start:164 stop:409 length:246 start_codon:yes stop_codon:yes gene_type:complete
MKDYEQPAALLAKIESEVSLLAENNDNEQIIAILQDVRSVRDTLIAWLDDQIIEMSAMGREYEKIIAMNKELGELINDNSK